MNVFLALARFLVSKKVKAGACRFLVVLAKMFGSGVPTLQPWAPQNCIKTKNNFSLKRASSVTILLERQLNHYHHFTPGICFLLFLKPRSCSPDAGVSWFLQPSLSDAFFLCMEHWSFCGCMPLLTLAVKLITTRWEFASKPSERPMHS